MILIVDFASKESKLKLYDNLKKLQEKPYKIEIKRDRDTRSGKQNKYYHAVIVPMISDYTGFELDEAHEVLKAKFLKYDRIIEATGEIVSCIKSTTDLDTWEFEQFTEQIRRFAAQDLDLIIPLPNEVLEI